MIESSDTKQSGKKPKFLHYGYLITIALFVTQIIVFIGSRSFSIALPDIQAALGVSVAEIGLVVAWYAGMANLGSIVWGVIGDKLGPRKSSIAAGFVFSAGMVLFGLFGATSYIHALAIWTFTGFGSSGLQETITPKLISAWFAPNKRGHAMRIVTSGGPSASIILGVVMPIGVVQFGWSTTFIMLGILVAVFTLFFLVIRNTPQEMGLAPIGAPDCTQPAPKLKKESSKNLFKEAIGLRITWHIGLVYILYQFYFTSHTTYYVANMRALGFSPAEAGLLVTIAGACSILMMQFWGPLSDRLGRKRVLMIMMVGASIMPIVIFSVSQTKPSLLTMYSIYLVMQLFCSGAPVFMAILADYFPQRLNGTCNGIVSFLSAFGSFFAPWVGGLIVDGFGAMYYYCLPMALGAFFCFIASSRLPQPQFKD